MTKTQSWYEIQEEYWENAKWASTSHTADTVEEIRSILREVVRDNPLSPGKRFRIAKITLTEEVLP